MSDGIFIKPLIRACLNSLNFYGRASRAEFWSFYIFHSIITHLPSILRGKLGAQSEAYTLRSNAILLIPFLSVYIRRLHDINRSGWLIIILFIIPIITVITTDNWPEGFKQYTVFALPILGLVMIINLTILSLKGTDGPNSYGANPVQSLNLPASKTENSTASGSVKQDLELIEKLFELKQKGILTKEEYEEKKSGLLGVYKPSGAATEKSNNNFDERLSKIISKDYSHSSIEQKIEALEVLAEMYKLGFINDDVLSDVKCKILNVSPSTASKH